MGWAARQKRPIEQRPTAQGLVVPYMVDATLDPIDFKAVDAEHVKRCATDRLCGICGAKLHSNEPIAFIGPNDGRKCFADPWMHKGCALIAMAQCPFLTGRSDWREEGDKPLLKTYAHNMKPFVAQDGRAHKDRLGAWHFEAVGPLQRLGMA